MYFKATAEDLVHALVNMRQSGVMMAHGMSGAGKTYTMEVCQKLQGVGLMQNYHNELDAMSSLCPTDSLETRGKCTLRSSCKT